MLSIGSPREAVIAAAVSPEGDSDVRACTRAPTRRQPGAKDLALQSQADGGIRTLDPRCTRVVWGRERRMREGADGSQSSEIRALTYPRWNLEPAS
jgi:hypothetical protein